MKIIKARYDLILFFFFPFCAIATLVYFFSFHPLTYINQFNWLLLCLLAVLCVLPVSKIPLGQYADNTHPVKWFLKLFFCQLLLCLITWSLSVFLSIDLITNKIYHAINFLHFSLSSGLFPWAFATFFSLTLGYFVYHKKAAGLVSSTYAPFFNNTHIDSIGVAVDSYMRFSLLGLFLFIFSLMVLSGIMLLRQTLPFPLLGGLSYSVAFLSCLLLLIVSNKGWLKLIHRLVHFQISTAFIMLGLILFTILLCPLLILLIYAFVTASPMLNVPSLHINTSLRNDHLLIILNIWSYLLAGFIGSLMAYISKNKTIRAAIINAFLAFLLSLGVIKLLDLLYESLGPHKLILPFCILLGSGAIIIGLMLSKKTITYFLRATLPTATVIKSRSNYQFLKMIPVTAISLLGTYLGMGIYLWSYLMVLAFIPPIAILLISYVSWLFELLKSQTGFNN